MIALILAAALSFSAQSHAQDASAAPESLRSTADKHFWISTHGGLQAGTWAPGATGNIVTEDVVFLAESLGFNTGIDLDALVKTREDQAGLTRPVVEKLVASC